MAANPHLAGLVEQFEVDRVRDACLTVLGFPWNLVTTTAEAIKVHHHLAAEQGA
jgi:hypothetical protein